jgi:hypothetical protein
VPAAWATGTADRNGLVDDATDGARAAAALGAAAETAINLPGRARRIAATERRADIVIAQHLQEQTIMESLAFPSGLFFM